MLCTFLRGRNMYEDMMQQHAAQSAAICEIGPNSTPQLQTFLADDYLELIEKPKQGMRTITGQREEISFHHSAIIIYNNNYTNRLKQIITPNYKPTNPCLKTTMKFTTLITAAALLLTSTVLANPVPNAEAGANPQICYCNLSCYDTCGQKLCCP
ncbi:hypothetical protein V495_03118 [Pseudogymnoascus sp. VKM F-4514 (FW-929)]|nr:hypothetical protein V490_03997 [Pseudogymnoascus sp. VKM F-3557]KFY45098.1 hypothetical protein V495_03118 [Pseudogymnoascus sp. VKM F-4514 (FW-929)]KFY52366.1 hypothetical protein V497_08536 [Pseudogymnoascus sp. VKM F-4516 (FW-969)]